MYIKRYSTNFSSNLSEYRRINRTLLFVDMQFYKKVVEYGYPRKEKSTMNQVKIGKFISECRKEKGLTQQELADRLGLTAKAVSKWETGKGLPDVSLYEAICKELGITLNEFFAGEHIEEQRLIVQTDENLEDILKEYYKMKRQKNIITLVLGIVAGFFVLQIIQIVKSLFLAGGVIAIMSIFDFALKPEVRTDITQYEKSYYIENYGGDLDSDLSIFPDKINDDIEVKYFESSLTTGLFDTDGYIVLEYTLNEADFQKEIARLSQLEKNIENYNGKVYKNQVMYAEDEYAYPAYITIDGYADTFEYALIDEENYRIICVYLAYIDSANFKYDEYLKLDKSCYKDYDNLDEFSIYTHTFDGGKSYVEYSD